MEKISYKLDVFEGPMDLLLHLISKHKLNIYDIPIVTLVEQYVDYVRQMQEEDMYVAAEFLEMAARLVYLKSVSFYSASPTYVVVKSHTNTSVTVEAKKAFSSPVIVRCDYTYYVLQNGYYVYGGRGTLFLQHIQSLKKVM